MNAASAPFTFLFEISIISLDIVTAVVAASQLVADSTRSDVMLGHVMAAAVLVVVLEEAVVALKDT